MTRTWWIITTCRRWSWYPSWLPFGSVTDVWEKQTTWAEAHAIATQAAGINGVYDVKVLEAN